MHISLKLKNGGKYFSAYSNFLTDIAKCVQLVCSPLHPKFQKADYLLCFSEVIILLNNTDASSFSVLDDPYSESSDLLCFSHLRWDFVTQRPQHLLQRAARDRRVFFWEEPIWHQPGELEPVQNGSLGRYLEVSKVSPSLWTIRPHLTWGIDCDEGQRELLDAFLIRFAIDQYVRWYYTPMALGFSAHLKSQATIYDCMDELSAFQGASPLLLWREEELLATADVVFTGGLSLYEAKRGRHANVHLYRSSIDVSHFAQAQTMEVPEPEDQSQIPHPRIGFYGVIDERLDINLLAEVALLRPKMQFILLGPVVKIDPITLPALPNIHYLPSKSYEVLPHYLSGWDAAMLPFALNEATLFISPTKTPEYLAAGKSVVSTPIHDVVRDYGEPGLVAIASSANEFAIALDKALVPPAPVWKRRVASKLAYNSWDSTWASMSRQIRLVQKSKQLATQAASSARRKIPAHPPVPIERIALTPLLSS